MVCSDLVIFRYFWFDLRTGTNLKTQKYWRNFAILCEKCVMIHTGAGVRRVCCEEKHTISSQWDIEEMITAFVYSGSKLQEFM